MGSIIETGVDKLVSIVNKKGTIAAADAAKELGLSTAVIREWADFLEDEGIINIEYRFARPYLVARKVAKKDVASKSKEFKGKRDVFIRKAESSLSYLDREASKLKQVKAEFESIKKDVGFDFGSIQKEMKELHKFESLKLDIEKQIIEQKNEAVAKLHDLSKNILHEKRKYHSILDQIKKEEKELQREKMQAHTIEDAEKMIKARLASLQNLVKDVERKVTKEELAVKKSEHNIQNLSSMARELKSNVLKEKSMLRPLLKESESHTKKIIQLQQDVLKKIAEKEKRFKGVKKASDRMKEVFKKKLKVMSLIEQANQDRDTLQKEFNDLIKKARSFQLSSKAVDVEKQIKAIEKRFKEVDKKRHMFESQFKRIGSLFKG